MAQNTTDAIIKYALAQVGKPYVWGATGPNGFDCSGLIVAAFESAGKSISRTTYTQVHQGKAVSPNVASLQPGDLVFPDAGHVQLYIGGGKVVEAPRTGLNVRVKSVGGIWAARRLLEPGSDASGVQASYPTGSTAVQAGLFDWSANLGGVFNKLVDAYFWLRIGEIVGGLVLIVLGVLSLKQVQNAAVSAAKVAAVV